MILDEAVAKDLDDEVDVELGRELLRVQKCQLRAKLRLGGFQPARLGTVKIRLVARNPAPEDIFWAQNAVYCEQTAQYHVWGAHKSAGGYELSKPEVVFAVSRWLE